MQSLCGTHAEVIRLFTPAALIRRRHPIVHGGGFCFTLCTVTFILSQSHVYQRRPTDSKLLLRRDRSGLTRASAFKKHGLRRCLCGWRGVGRIVRGIGIGQCGV